MYTIPHIFVWGSCFWLCTSASPPRLSLTHLTHTQLVTTQLTHTTQRVTTQLTHTQLVTTQLVTTHNLLPHNLSTHNLSTHNLLTHNFAWHAWHLWHWAGSGGALGYFGRRGCLRSRHGTWRHRPSLSVAGVALGDMDLHFAWQAWHLWRWTGSGGALGYFGRRGCLRGRHGAGRHRPSLCVAGMALGDMDVRSAWQAWRLWHWTGSAGALGHFGRRGCLRGRRHLATSTFTLRRWRGTWWHRPSFCVAGVALMALGWLWRRAWVLWSRLFAWQAWRLPTSTFTLRGRRGTWWHRPSLCVAGMALGDMDVRSAWQAWHLWHNFVTQAFHTQLCHTQLFHTQLCHTQLFHTQLFHTQLCHIHLFHTHTIFYTQLCHIHLFHTHTHNLLHTTLSHTTLSHTTLLHTQTYTHNIVTHSSFTQPVLHHLLSFLPFPSHFHICLWSLEEVDLWGYPVL